MPLYINWKFLLPSTKTWKVLGVNKEKDRIYIEHRKEKYTWFLSKTLEDKELEFAYYDDEED